MKRLLFFILILGFILTDGVFMVSIADDASKRGWWWYEKTPPPQEDQKAEEPKYPDLSTYTMEDLWNMDSETFRKMLQAALDKATYAPTVENVRQYLVLQDIARRKALAFMNTASLIVQTTPEFNTLKDAPVVVPGISATTKAVLDDIETTIKGASEDYGLLYFYSPVCPYCKVQDDINKLFINKYNWQIKSIDITQNELAAEQFGVTTTPTLILVYRYSDDYLPVVLGAVSLGTMEQNIMKGIKLMRGEVTPENYNLYEYQRKGPFDPKSILTRDKKNQNLNKRSVDRK
jgi:conjugal transfer pilus assembly protein TraF